MTTTSGYGYMQDITDNVMETAADMEVFYQDLKCHFIVLHCLIGTYTFIDFGIDAGEWSFGNKGSNINEGSRTST